LPRGHSALAFVDVGVGFADRAAAVVAVGFHRIYGFCIKIVINDNIIEQVTDFKYLGYRISEYKNDLEDKLQT